MMKPRYIAIRHDGQAHILEGEYGEHYQYAVRDSRRRFPTMDPLLIPPDDTMHTRYILKVTHVYGSTGRFRVFLPDTWTEDECSAFIKREETIVRLGPALMDPHQTDRSRQMERYYHGAPRHYGDLG